MDAAHFDGGNVVAPVHLRVPAFEGQLRDRHLPPREPSARGRDVLFPSLTSGGDLSPRSRHGIPSTPSVAVLADVIIHGPRGCRLGLAGRAFDLLQESRHHVPDMRSAGDLSALRLFFFLVLVVESPSCHVEVHCQPRGLSVKDRKERKADLHEAVDPQDSQAERQEPMVGVPSPKPLGKLSHLRPLLPPECDPRRSSSRDPWLFFLGAFLAERIWTRVTRGASGAWASGWEPSFNSRLSSSTSSACARS